MTELLPIPLVPPEVDLRDYPKMMLDVRRLRDSDLAAQADGEVFRAAVLSWCAAWHQQPAASLPDDDATLARLLGYGRDVKAWRKLRAAGALRGFIKCSDGRLYHHVVAEAALEAWRQRRRFKAAADARWRARSDAHASQSASAASDACATDDTTHLQEKGREWKGRESPSDAIASSGAPPVDPPGSQPSAQADDPPSVPPMFPGEHSAEPATDPLEIPDFLRRPKPDPRGSRLPPDWQPSPDLLEWAAAEHPAVDAATVTAEFRDYWASIPGSRGRKLDWPATWRNRVREVAGRARGRPNGAAPQRTVGDALDRLDADLAERRS